MKRIKDILTEQRALKAQRNNIIKKILLILKLNNEIVDLRNNSNDLLVNHGLFLMNIFSFLSHKPQSVVTLTESEFKKFIYGICNEYGNETYPMALLPLIRKDVRYTMFFTKSKKMKLNELDINTDRWVSDLQYELKELRKK